MGMPQMPAVTELRRGVRFWSHAFDRFRVKTLVPTPAPLADIVNFGFQAPYLLVLEETELSPEEALDYAEKRGLLALAGEYSTSVVFVSPAGEGGWDAADEQLYIDLIAESRIQQYYRDGVILSRNRFTHEWGECFIRGAIFRVCLYGAGKSADYIARCLLKTIEGLYLWGPGEITPLGATLERLSVVPEPERRDIPIVSVNNSDAVNAALQARCDLFRVSAENACREDYHALLGRWKRWCGHLEEEPDMAGCGMVEEPGCATVKTSPDNRGDDAGTEEHRIGYIAYYWKDLFEQGPVPLVLAFHGGGDSALHIAHVSGWWRVAMRHGFLLVAVENHLNSTATEAVELIARLRERYPIDGSRIYASGFSMGGCKSWDLMQEYPEVFAALAPMDATFEVGLNVYGQPAPAAVNRTVPVPLFYAGGEITPLPELPFQAEKCWDRMRYVFEVNQIRRSYDVRFEDRERWENPIWGLDGDRTERYDDPSRGSVLTVQLFESRDGVVRTAFASVSGQGHECREHTCEHAWRFMSQFTR
ncbi:MAG: hypothetical protein IKH38_00615 [Clostridia bacterium]|nr:hypothetical protein [Clostridia bacterium]